MRVCLSAKMDLMVLSAKIDLDFHVFICENGSRGGFICENGTKGKRMFLSAKMDRGEALSARMELYSKKYG